MSVKFFKKLRIKLLRLPFERWFGGLFAVLAVGFVVAFISIFNEATKQDQAAKATTQLAAAKSQRDSLYDELIDLIYFEYFDKEHLDEEELKKTYKADLLVVLNSIARLPDYYYRRLLEDMKVLREMSLNLRLSSLPVSSEIIKDKDFPLAENGARETFNILFKTIKDDYKVVIKDVLNLPTRYYKRFLSLLDELRELEKPTRSKSLKKGA